MKSSLINSTVYLNDQVIDSASNLDPYTVYVNPFYVVTGFQGGDRVSKHYYMNQQRVATDITINYDPSSKGGGQQEQLSAKGTSSSETAWSPALTDFNEVLVGLGQKPLDTASLELPTIESYYPETATTPATSSSTESTTAAPRILFWYHPDYLGNVDLITEREGYTHEFFMYNPWGEEMHQWNANTYAFTSPYRFNAKELDPETGLAYYGARYYQNKLGVWLSVDPLANFLPGLSPFVFSSNNPLSIKDPDGKFPQVIVGMAIGITIEITSQIIFEGKDPSNLDILPLIVAGAAGALSGGVSSFCNFGRYGTLAANSGIDAVESIASQSAKNKEISPAQTLTDIAFGLINVDVKVVDNGSIKVMERQLDRAKRVASGPNPRASRVEEVANTNKRLEVAKFKNNTATTAATSSAQFVVGGTIQIATTSIEGPPVRRLLLDRQNSQDNTKIIIPIIY